MSIITVRFGKDIIEYFKERYKGTIIEYLGIELAATDGLSLFTKMSVTDRTSYSQGILHGGISLLLGETIGSFASLCSVRDDQTKCVTGISATANHIAIASPGDVLHAETSPLHTGKQTHFWSTTIRNQNSELISVVHLTTLIFERGRTELSPSQSE